MWLVLVFSAHNHLTERSGSWRRQASRPPVPHENLCKCEHTSENLRLQAPCYVCEDTAMKMRISRDVELEHGVAIPVAGDVTVTPRVEMGGAQLVFSNPELNRPTAPWVMRGDSVSLHFLNGDIRLDIEPPPFSRPRMPWWKRVVLKQWRRARRAIRP